MSQSLLFFLSASTMTRFLPMIHGLFFISPSYSMATQPTDREGEAVSLCPGKPEDDSNGPSWCRDRIACRDEIHCASASEDCHLRVSPACYDELVSVVESRCRRQHLGFCLNGGKCHSAEGKTFCACDDPSYRGTHCEIPTERVLQEEDPTFSPSVSAHPTTTFYPTSSPPPTTSAYPTKTNFPTSVGDRVTDSSFIPTSSLFPTGTFLPTGTPSPTSSIYPTTTSVPSLAQNETVITSMGPTATPLVGSLLPSMAPTLPFSTRDPTAMSTPRPTRFPISQQQPTPNYRPTPPSSTLEDGVDDDDDLSSAGIGAILVGVGALLIIVAWFVRPCSSRRRNGSPHRRTGYRSELELQHFDDDLI